MGFGYLLSEDRIEKGVYVCKGTRNTNRRAYYCVVNDTIDNSVLVGAGSASGSTDTEADRHNLTISEADRLR